MSRTRWLYWPGENKGHGEEKEEIGTCHCKPPWREDVAPVVERGGVLDKEVDGDHHCDGACVD